MLVVQHIWSRWTKRARGANAALKRPRLDEAYPLPQGQDDGETLLHSVHALEQDGFELVSEAFPVTREQGKRSHWNIGIRLDWRVRDGAAEIMLNKETERLQTKWPAFLPSPLFTLRAGETARIDWNGRFRTSMGDSDRSSYYEQHIYWLALAETPEPRLFLDAKPRKHVDLRTEIY
jgi:hypothetical protein